MPKQFFRLYFNKKDLERVQKILILFQRKNFVPSISVDIPWNDGKYYFMIPFEVREKLIEFLINQQKTYINYRYILELDTNYNKSSRNISLRWERR